MISALVFFALAFGLAPAAFAAGAARLSGWRGERLQSIIAAAPSGGPLLLALIAYASFRAVPRVSPAGQAALCAAGLALILWLARPALGEVAAETARFLRAFRPRSPAYAGLACGLLLLSLAQILFTGLTENDGLEFLALAQRIAASGSLALYPMREAAADGFFTAMTHPGGYPALLALALRFESGGGFLAARFLNAGLLIALCLSAAFMARRLTRFPGAGSAAVVFLLGAPLLTFMAAGQGVDMIRVAALSAALVLALEWKHGEGPGAAFLLGFAGGLCLFVHATGILAPPLMLAVAAARGEALSGLRPASLAAAAAGFALATGEPLLRNFLLFGAVLSDGNAVSAYPAFRWDEDMAARRGLGSPAGLLINGLLRYWSEPALLGIAGWLALPAALASWRIARFARLKPAAFACAAFFAIAIAAAAAGHTRLLQNGRYAMTILPAAAVAAAGLLGALPRLAAAAVLSLSCLWAVLGGAARLDGYFQPLSIASGREHAALSLERNQMGPLIIALQADPARAKVLAFRQAELGVFGPDGWIDQFDPAVLPLLSAPDKESAYAALRAAGISHVLVPWTVPPTLGNTAIAAVLGDPRLTDFAAAHRDARLWRLRELPAAVQCAAAEPEYSYRSNKSGFLGAAARLTGIPRLGQIGAAPGDAAADVTADSLAAAGGQIIVRVRGPASRYQFVMSLRGKGTASISASIPGSSIPQLAWQGILPQNGARQVAVQAFSSGGEAVIEITGVRPLDIVRLSAEAC